MARLKAFLSYNHSDKSIASRIKTRLQHYGVETLLAHDDIRPTQEWETRILDELGQMHVFLPLLTDAFRKSEWTSSRNSVCYCSTGVHYFIKALRRTHLAL